MTTRTGDPRRTWAWQRQRAALLRVWGPRPVCWRCGELILGTVVAGHIADHALGGSARADNLAPECLPCSRRAGGQLRTALYGPWPKRGRPGHRTPAARPAPTAEPPAIY